MNCKTKFRKRAFSLITTTQDLKGIAPLTKFPTTDGAGPVIWSVVKDIKALDDRTQDVVTITLSEPIQSPNGSAFAVGSQPNLVLYIWTKDSSGTYIRDSIMLSGIGTFDDISSDGKTITFRMTNGNDLTASDHISIAPNSTYIADKSNLINIPSANNQKVPVAVISTIPNVIIVGPIPADLHCNFRPAKTRQSSI